MKLALLFCGLVAYGHLVAQSTGTLRGTVADQSGAVIPGALVTATSANGQVKSTPSTADGSYVLNGLAPGDYSIEAASAGFVQARPATATIDGSQITLNLVLHIRGEAQQVTVTESSGPMVSIDPAQSASAQVLGGDALDSISDDADDMLTDLQNLAGPAAGLNAAQIFIDGFTAGDGALPSKDAIREVRINQNPFAPEFDTLGTGHIEILTKPGTDQFRGSAYYSDGNDALNSRNLYAAEKATFNLRDVGGNFSGPINKHGSFSLDLDKRNIDNGEVISAVTLNPSTLVATPFTGVAVSPLRHLYLGARLDYQLNSKNTLIVRYEPNYNSSTNGGIGTFTLPSEAYRSSLMEHAVQATDTATLGTNTINETRFQFRHQNSA